MSKSNDWFMSVHGEDDDDDDNVQRDLRTEPEFSLLQLNESVSK